MKEKDTNYPGNGKRYDNNAKASLMEEYQKAKKAHMELRMNTRQEKDNSARWLVDLSAATNSSTFEAAFREGTISVSVFADQGTDANFTSKTLWEENHQ